ncbi:MAG: DUF3800 domain-containing protein [Planctomycetota bacterium]
MRIAFVDEAGNKDIDVPKEGATVFYVVAAVIIDEADLDDFNVAAEVLASNHFRGGPIKSAKIGGRYDRRERVLESLADVPGTFYALVVDKRRIDKTSGLQYPRSFYKWIQRLLEGELFRSYPELRLIVDRQGDEEFQKTFVAYMKRHYPGELFAHNAVEFRKSSDCRGVQIADLIAGSLAKAVEGKEETGETPQFFERIRERLVYYGPWPRQEFPYHLSREGDGADRRFDSRLIEFATRRSQAFLEEHGRSTDPDRRAQVVCLKQLLYQHRNVDPRAYVFGRSLVRHIERHLPDHIGSEQALMARVVAPLRDAGVLVVASAKGYKIPVCTGDLVAHVDNTCKKIRPMLNRMRQFRNAVRLATDNDVDLYEERDFGFLARFDDL